MHIHMLKAKIHRATVTQAELHYEGSCAIDADLLAAAGIHEYERIDVYNVANGERFSTYTIRGEAGSGMISVNGAAAHRAKPGDIIIVCAYALLDAGEVASFHPRLVYVDHHNRITRIKHAIEPQRLDVAA